MRVTIDEGTCVGCGLCEQSCPEVFKVEGDGLAHLKSQNCSAGHNLQEVADNCPVSCIKVG